MTTQATKEFKQLSPNFWEGRQGHKPEAFVIHVSEGSFEGSLSWILDPKSAVSYHFLISEFGEVAELVKPENSAWHAGKILNPTWSEIKEGVNPNLYTIGIAFAGFAKDGPTMNQFCTIASLLQHLSVIHSIPLDRKHVVGHNEIRADKICPGEKANLDALLYFAQLQTPPIKILSP
jgi:N-acetylmuramoyl-L-alanine amidase